MISPLPQAFTYHIPYQTFSSFSAITIKWARSNIAAVSRKGMKKKRCAWINLISKITK